MNDRYRELPGISIDHLEIQLPAGYGPRANAIARQTAHELARTPVGRSAALSSVEAPAVGIAGSKTNGMIARRIARAIHAQIAADTRPGAHHPAEK